MFKSLFGAVCALAVFAPTVSADIFGLEEQFASHFTEGFELYDVGGYPLIDVFDETGFVTAIGANESPQSPMVQIFTGVTINGVNVHALSGAKMMGNTFSDDFSPGIRWHFDKPAQKFGGYFATNNLTGNATALFYDKNNNLLGQKTIFIPIDGTWVWNGWESTGEGIARIDVLGNGNFGPGFIFHDDMSYIPIPTPACGVLLVVFTITRNRRRS